MVERTVEESGRENSLPLGRLPKGFNAPALTEIVKRVQRGEGSGFESRLAALAMGSASRGLAEIFESQAEVHALVHTEGALARIAKGLAEVINAEIVMGQPSSAKSQRAFATLAQMLRVEEVRTALKGEQCAYLWPVAVDYGFSNWENPKQRTAIKQVIGTLAGDKNQKKVILAAMEVENHSGALEMMSMSALWGKMAWKPKTAAGLRAEAAWLDKIYDPIKEKAMFPRSRRSKAKTA